MRTAVVLFCALVSPLFAQAPPATTIDADTTWSGKVAVKDTVQVRKGTLTVEPGCEVTFAPGAILSISPGAALVAKGTAEKPVVISAENEGKISTYGSALFERCRIEKMGIDKDKRNLWLDGDTRAGVTLKDCTLNGCGGIWLNLSDKPFAMSGCDVRDARFGIRLAGKGTAEIEGNTFEGDGFSVGSGAQGVVRGNVVIRGTLGSWDADKLVVERNYVHQPGAKGSYALLNAVGTIRDNVFRGGSWVSAQIGGRIVGNVFISLPHEERRELEGGFNANCTHEHVCGLLADSTVERNIFVGASYGAVMGIGGGTCSDSVIRNNTFDMKGSGWAVYLNHLPKNDPKNIVIRGNLFMRCAVMQSEKPIADSTKYIDYNLYSATGKKDPRYYKIEMAGKKPGDEGFGARDIPPVDKPADEPAPADVVANPDVEFPFTDEDMLARKHTVDELLKIYRDAYTPKAGSPAVDAGDPADAADPAVADGKADIGAIELKK